jgi:hypothetical protein
MNTSYPVLRGDTRGVMTNARSLLVTALNNSKPYSVALVKACVNKAILIFHANGGISVIEEQAINDFLLREFNYLKVQS